MGGPTVSAAIRQILVGTVESPRRLGKLDKQGANAKWYRRSTVG